MASNLTYSKVVADMAAASTPATTPTSTLADEPENLSLANLAQTAKHPEQYWDGRRETLGSFLTEFETTLATVDPDLHEFAVECACVCRLT